EEQRAISQILGALDDKIENNTKINHHLEQMAQAIFKSWFVDFDPWSGVMPSGWRVEKLGNLCQSVSRTHSFEKDNLIFLNTGDIDNGLFLHANYSPVQSMPGQAKKSILRGDILYSEIRPINRHFAYVYFDAPDYIVSTKLMVIRANGIDGRRLYHYLTSKNVITELQVEAESRSGTFPQIRFENIQQMDILLATPDIEEDFAALLLDTYATIDAHNAESAYLVSLRDILLPRLMSGELSVADI
ncbi:MAG: restriction endonuclease subunit S, partial [Synergistaceae bacterium]|nr:restriction endonuclease subunit S [Synergistaceae bacterium]